jgi:hypothetical protein
MFGKPVFPESESISFAKFPVAGKLHGEIEECGFRAGDSGVALVGSDPIAVFGRNMPLPQPFTEQGNTVFGATRARNGQQDRTFFDRVQSIVP